jgi:hypothetical protein
MDQALRQRLDVLGRAKLLHILMLPDLERAERIGEFWSYPERGLGRAMCPKVSAIRHLGIEPADRLSG